METGVPSTRRDIFLDHDRDPAAIERKFELLKRRAKQQGYAVGIGHPYRETLTYLESQLPKLETEGFQLVSVRELIRMQQGAAFAGRQLAKN